MVVENPDVVSGFGQQHSLETFHRERTERIIEIHERRFTREQIHRVSTEDSDVSAVSESRARLRGDRGIDLHADDPSPGITFQPPGNDPALSAPDVGQDFLFADINIIEDSPEHAVFRAFRGARFGVYRRDDSCQGFAHVPIILRDIKRSPQGLDKFVQKAPDGSRDDHDPSIDAPPMVERYSLAMYPFFVMIFSAAIPSMRFSEAEAIFHKHRWILQAGLPSLMLRCGIVHFMLLITHG